jgi:prepilin-type N-terminal cleavage/methylation domain-containing protein
MNRGTPDRTPSSRGPRAFTLVELLTVVAIIGLLISIVVPSIGAARDAAKVAKAKTTMKALGDALEVFRGDNDAECKGNEYPPSRAGDDPTVTGNNTALGSEDMSGAQWLVRYLMGKDLNGYIPEKSVPGGLGTAGQEQMKNGKSWYELNYSRAPAYVHQAPVKPPRDLPGGQGDTDTSLRGTNWVFVDSYNMPICYYAANSRIATRPNAPIAAYDYPTGAVDPNQLGIYNYRDNAIFTGLGRGQPDSASWALPGWDFGSGAHKMTFGPSGWDSNPSQIRLGMSDDTKYSFGAWIMDKQAWETSHQQPNQAVVKPVRKDSFILWSPGKDGLFGTKDDVQNF